jgi:hypothetical protein
MTGDTFTCEVCGGTFDKGRSDEEAMAEMRATWQPHEGDDDLGTVCDPCFDRFMAWARSNIPEFLK